MTPTVRCQRIVKSFSSGHERLVVIREATLEVQPRELLMLVGPSGCGKTTLISIIAGILSYDSGECEVLGQNYKHMSARDMLDFRAQNIGFIFQSFHLLPSLNAMENVAIPLIINRTPTHIAHAKAREMLAEVGLKDRMQSMPSQLSGGEQQRVAIARGLVHEPKLLICDEPTSALDHHTGEKIMQTIRKLQQTIHTSVLIVTHDPRVYQYADRIAYMDDGHIEKIESQLEPLVQG